MLKDLKICLASGGHQMSYLMNVKHFAARKSGYLFPRFILDPMLIKESPLPLPGCFTSL